MKPEELHPLISAAVTSAALASEESCYTQARPGGRVLMIVLTVVVAVYLLWLMVGAPAPALTERIGEGLFVLWVRRR